MRSCSESQRLAGNRLNFRSLFTCGRSAVANVNLLLRQSITCYSSKFVNNQLVYVLGSKGVSKAIKKIKSSNRPVEIFVEGTRSRDRRFLKPKTGFLRAMIEEEEEVSEQEEERTREETKRRGCDRETTHRIKEHSKLTRRCSVLGRSSSPR